MDLDSRTRVVPADRHLSVYDRDPYSRQYSCRLGRGPSHGHADRPDRGRDRYARQFQDSHLRHIVAMS